MAGDDLSEEARLYFANQLRESRLEALQDAEGFDIVIQAIERLGMYLAGEDKQGFGKYQPVLADLCRDCRGFGKLYELVREGRNDAFHQGAFARHLTRHTVELAIVLEDGLRSKMNKVESYMVRSPVCAAGWQSIALIRQQMLVNSFSYLPVRNGEQWMLIQDSAVVKCLRGTEGRKKRLAATLQEMIDQQVIILTRAATACESDEVSEIVEHLVEGPVLVMKTHGNEQHLVGIVTAFDLL